jgi:hypothetical protein
MSQGAIRKVELPSLFIICNRYSTEIANQSTQMNKQRAILVSNLNIGNVNSSEQARTGITKLPRNNRNKIIIIK